jgi:serine/threonine-protein kinase
MGEVYLAEDTDLKRKVALKFLPEAVDAKPEMTSRFRHEAQAAAALSHPNIATVYEVSEHEGRPFLSCENET